MRILLLGGTGEAAALAKILAREGRDAVYSYAGRVASPAAQPLPVRIGGFGGVDGLVQYLRDHAITHLVDATHPFAARISWNAYNAAVGAGVKLIALERAPWQETEGEHWTRVADYEAAAAALPENRTNVFLAIGKQNLRPFMALPHRYLLRFAAPDDTVALPADSRVLVQRGPFDIAGDLALLRNYDIRVLVAKNAGGDAARAKLAAARQAGVEVVMIERPELPLREVATSPQDVMARL